MKRVWIVQNRKMIDDEGLANAFKGLADLSRLRILNLLFHGEFCGCDIQFAMKASQSSISRHLTYLKKCGLVLDRRSGFRVYYRLATAVSADHGLLFGYLERAFDRNGTFKDDLKRLKDAVKDGSCTVSDPQIKKTVITRQKGQGTYRVGGP